MSQNLLANMTIGLSANAKGFVDGVTKAKTSLVQFQGAADKLKGVDLSTLKVGFDRQVNSLSSLQKAAREYGKALRFATDEKEIKELNAALEKTQAEMQRIRNLGRTSLTGITTSGKQATASMEDLKGSAGAVNGEFARIIQDVPFGMQGIGNNIQQLTANFGQLAQQAGGTKAALSATLTSLVSPASLLTLGIAALTSGYVLYEQWAQKSSKATKEKASALQSAKKASEEYKDTLDSLTRSSLTGAQDAQKEITSLRILYKATQNTTLSMQDRLKAVGEIQKQYPSYFEGFTKEEILAGKAKEAYDKLSTSILATARARAAQDLIADKARQQLENEQKIVDLKREQGKAEAEAQKRAANASKIKVNGGTASGGAIAGAVALDAQKQEQKINDIIGERSTLQKANAKLGQEMLQLEKEVFAQMQQGATLTTEDEGGSKGTKEKLTALQQLRKEFDAANASFLVYGNAQEALGDKTNAFKTAISSLIDQGLSPQSALIQRLRGELNALPGVLDPAANSFELFSQRTVASLASVAAGFKAIPVALEEMSLKANEVYQRDLAIAEAAAAQSAAIADYVHGAVSASIGGIGEVLGNALAGVSMGAGDIAATILMPFADMAVQLGQYAIGLGIGVEAIKKSLVSFSGVGAIAAGVALVALGTAAKAALGNMAKGKGGTAPKVPSVGSSSTPRPNQNSTKMSGEKELRFVIEGRSLVAITKAQSAYEKRIGNGW